MGAILEKNFKKALINGVNYQKGKMNITGALDLARDHR